MCDTNQQDPDAGLGAEGAQGPRPQVPESLLKRTRLGLSPVVMAMAVAVGGSLSLTGCDRLAADTSAHAASEAQAPKPPPVTVVTLQEQTVQTWDEFNGRVAAVEMVELRPRVSGYIERISFTEGENVRKGQVLFTIDARPYQAALGSAEAQLEKARAALQLAQTLDRRAQALLVDRAISREEADNRSASVAQAQASVRAAQAEVTSAKLNLEFTQVRAPISGKAGRALLTVGNLAQTDQSVLTTLASLDPVYVYFDADEQSLQRYQGAAAAQPQRVQRPVRVGLASDSGFPHAGVLNFTDNQLDPGTGTIRVRALLKNPDERFTPGMFARVQLQEQSPLTAVLIDDKAVLTDQDRQYAYVVGAGNQAERRELKLGRLVDGKRAVLSGLKAGDRLVVAGLQRIYFPGMPIDPQELAAPAVPEKKN